MRLFTYIKCASSIPGLLFILLLNQQIIQAETHIIRFGGDLGNTYDPAELTVTVGDTVEWQGDSFQFHPLSSTDIPDGAESFHQANGSVFQYIIEVAGQYDYQCDFHVFEGMVGTITAEPADPEPQPATSYIAFLLGSKEVPPNDSEGQGGGMFILNGTEDSLWYYIRACDLTGPISAAHFHHGAEGVAGPVVRGLSFDSTGYTEGVWTSSDAQPLTEELVAELKAGNIYVNVHTAMYPAGEIRGQVTDDEEVTLYATLTGDQEVPPVETDASGDGVFVLSGDGKSLEYHVTYENLSADLTAAHFHRNPAGVAGPVVRGITFEGNTSTGTWMDDEDVQPLTPSLVADLLGCYLYVNVHTSNFPAGEIRGQITKDQGEDPEPQPATSYIAFLLGSKEVPPNDSEGQGGGMFILNGTEDSLWYYIRVCDLTGPLTAAHFHRGAPDVAGPVVRGLSFDSTGYTEGVWTSSDAQPLTEELVAELKAGNIYVNAHTAMYPAGEIRGQITNNESVTLYASLTGDQEVPQVETDASGDGIFVLSGDGKSLDYHVTYQNLSAELTAAHFHRNPAGVTGPVVRGITFENGISMGTWMDNEETQPLTPSLVADLLGCYLYVNVHTSNFPAGEIRGQILKDVEDDDDFPYMTFWAVNDANDGKLFYYTLSEGHDFSNVEGNITGIESKDIEDLAIAEDGTIYFVNNVGTSKIYMISADQLDKDPNTSVNAELVGDTELPAGAQPDEIASLHFIDGTLYGIGKETGILYSISTEDGSVTEVSQLSEEDFRTDDLVLGADSTVYLLKTVVEGPSEIWMFDDFPNGEISMVTEIESSHKLEALAAHPNGNLYAADMTNLFEIDLNAGTIAVLSDYNVDIEGMEFNYRAEMDKPVQSTRKFTIIGELTDVNESSVKPTAYKLERNYPNPFNPSTIIKYSLPEASNVKIEVYNSLGEIVKILVNENRNAGEYQISFDAAGFPSGVYIYRIEAGSFIQSHKMILMK